MVLAELCGRIAACWEYYLAMVFAQNAARGKTPEEQEKINLALSKIFGYSVPLTFTQWNGQTPKHATCRRCEEFMGLPEGSIDEKSIANNWADAMMMGKWYCRKRLMVKAVANKDAEKVDL